MTLAIVSERLTKIREDKHMTQKELAKMVGCSEKTIYRIEGGEASGIKYAKDIAYVLCCDVDYLLGKSDIDGLTFDNTQRRVIDAVIAGIHKDEPITMTGDAWIAIFPEEEQRSYVYRLIGKAICEDVIKEKPVKLDHMNLRSALFLKKGDMHE